MIYALKHVKTGKYIATAIGKLSIQPGSTKWNGDTKNVQFRLTDNLLQARQIEDPNMDMVYKFGLEPIPLKLTQAVLERDGYIIEH